MPRALRAAPRPPLLSAAVAAMAALWLCARFIRLVATAPDGTAAAAALPVAATWLSVVVPGVLLARAAGFLGGPGGSARFDAVEATAAVLVCGTGAAMALQWVLYALSARTPAVQRVLFAATVLAGARGAVRVFASRPRRAFPLAPTGTFALAALFGAAAGVALAGQPYSHWDAVLSWDKWATDAAARSGLGRHVCGGYPQGVPLLLSAAFQIAGPAALDPLSSPHLLAAAALHAVFALAAAFSVAAAARRFGASAAVSLAVLVFLPDVRARFFDPGAYGLADLPAAALAVGALVIASAPEPADAGAGRLHAPAARRLALAAAFFGALFAKGNGLVHLPLVVAAAVFVRGRGSLRRVAAPALAALALALPFWAHQWWYGVHLDMPGADPLLHSMEVFVGHTRLFTPDAAHLSKWLAAATRAVAPRLSFSEPGKAVVAAWCAAVCAAACFRRRGAPLGVMALALGAAWFFTASYDARNALSAEFFLALCAGAAVREAAAALRAARMPGPFPAALPGAVAAALLLLSALGAHGAGRGGAFSGFGVPAFWRARPAERAARVSDVRHFHDFWREAPWAARARRLVAFSRDVRLWKGKGVYAVQRPALRGPAPGDLHFSFLSGPREVRPPAPFVPVATVANHRLGRTLSEAFPAFSDVPSVLTRADTGAAVAAGEVLPAGAVVRIAPETDRRDGLAELVFDREVPGAALRLAPESVRRDPYAKLFRSVSCGEAVRTVWWTRKAAEPPVFEATLPREAAIRGFRLGI